MPATTRRAAPVDQHGLAVRVCYSPVLGAELAPGDLSYDLWARIQATSAAGPAQSRAILERHLAALR